MIDKTDNLPPPLVSVDQLKRDFAHLEAELAALEAVEIPNVFEDQDDMNAATKVAVDLTAIRRRIEIARTEQSRPVLDAQAVINDYFKRELNERASKKQQAIDVPARAFLKKKADREKAAREAAAAIAQKEAEEARRRALAAAAAAVGATTPASAIHTLQQQNKADELSTFANKAAAAASAPISELSRTRADTGSSALQAMWAFEITDFAKLDMEMLRDHFTASAIDAAMRAFIKSGGRDIAGANIYEVEKPRYRG